VLRMVRRRRAAAGGHGVAEPGRCRCTLRWTPHLPFRFDRDAVYTLRGRRQVGKSTVLKRRGHAVVPVPDIDDVRDTIQPR